MDFLFVDLFIYFEFKHCVGMHIGYTICVIIHTTA